MNDRFQPDKVDFSRERLDFRPKRADFRSERDDIRPRRPDFRPERADFRPERAWGGGERKDERTKVPCVLQDFVPFGAAALPLIPIYNHAKQGNGYR